MRRSICALTLSLALLLAVPPVRALAAEGDFSPVRAYEEQFADVSPRDWFYTPVKALYELGLTNGQGRDGSRCPQREQRNLVSALR